MSRQVARTLAARLSSWSERVGALEPCQFGFQPHRQTVDLLFIALAEALSGGALKAAADPLALLAFDIKKASRHCSRSVTWEVYQRLGLTAETIELIRGLHSTTDYTIQTPFGRNRHSSLRGLIIQLYWLQSGSQCWFMAALSRTSSSPVHRRGETGSISALDFEDNSSCLTRLSQCAAAKTTVLDNFAALSEVVHPDRTKRIDAPTPSRLAFGGRMAFTGRQQQARHSTAYSCNSSYIAPPASSDAS
eukprot:262898-Amphidinium_carterae.2